MLVDVLLQASPSRMNSCSQTSCYTRDDMRSGHNSVDPIMLRLKRGSLFTIRLTADDEQDD
jgi:hypothetical protein